MFLNLSGKSPSFPQPFPWVEYRETGLEGQALGPVRARGQLLQSSVIAFEVTIGGMSSCPKAHSWTPKTRSRIVSGMAGFLQSTNGWSPLQTSPLDNRGERVSRKKREPSRRGKPMAPNSGGPYLQPPGSEHTYQISEEREPMEIVKRNGKNGCQRSLAGEKGVLMKLTCQKEPLTLRS